MSEEMNRTNSIPPEEYREMKQQEKNKVFDLLSESTQSLMQPEELMKYLDLQSRFMNLSVSNVLLIKAQNPEAVWVRTFDEWKSDNISLLKGETGIMSLDSSYYQRQDGSMGRTSKVVRLFDISQTTAKDRQISRPVYRNAAAYITAASEIPAEKSDKVAEGLDAAVHDCKLSIREDLTPEQAFYAAAREIACMQMSADENTGRDDVLPYGECAAYILAKRFDLPCGRPDTDRLIEHFTGMEEKEVRKELSGMKQTVMNMEKKMLEARQRDRESKETER